MNDRFKFRVYVTENDAYPEKVGYVNTEDFYIHPDGEESYFNADYDFAESVIEQCTGIKDKNGKLIYEGDIVKLSSDREVVCPVVWDNEETGFCVKYKKELYRFNPYKKYHLIEVIGNIHENADLIKVGEK